MKKTVNIQRDVESRKIIESGLSRKNQKTNEPAKTKQDAQSQIVPGPQDNQPADPVEEKAKKTGKAKGNEEKVSV